MTLSYADYAEIDEFERSIAAWRSGEIDDETFRSNRLHMGCYGIRQSDTHMLRVKLPGGVLAPDHLDAVADVAELYSRGFAHVTTRQNFQVHFVTTDDAPKAMRRLADAGLTTREACGNSVRTVTQSHLVGIDPTAVVDTRPAVEALTRYFLRNPLVQSLPRKFKMAFDGSAADHAQLGIHDIGFLGTTGEGGRAGFRLYVGGGLGSAPREADLLEPFTPAERVLPTVEAILTVFDAQGERRNRVRARMKFLVDKMGIEAFREEVFALREQLETDRTYPALEVPIVSTTALTGVELPAPPADLEGQDLGAFLHWRDANVFAYPTAAGHAFAAFGTFHLGDLTSTQLRAIAKEWRSLGEDTVEVRTTIRQNFLFANLDADQVGRLWRTLHDHGMDLARAEKSGDVVSCPGAETCNLAITASRGLGGAITEALEGAGLHEIEDVRVNVSGCPNACGQHTTADIGFSGMARRDGDGNEAPGYRVYVGASLGQGGVNFGHYVAKVPALKAPEVAVTLLERYGAERDAGERFADWVARVGKDDLKASLKSFDAMPSKAEDPSYYVDFGLTEPFRVILGRGECA